MATATLLLPPCPRLLDPSSSSSSSYSHRFGPSRLGLGRARPWLELPSRAESSKRRRRRRRRRLFVISVPGLWSLIKRSVKSKIVQKTFVREEGAVAPPNQVAGEILSFFTRNNFAVTDRGETITFEGVMVPSRGQAALLTFCTCISLGSVALVLSIAVPEGGNNWFWLMTLSPLAGVYYWTKASRKEEIKVKMVLGDDGSLSEIIVRGDDQQVEQMRKELRLSEKGMIYVKGIFER
ncbi:Protein COFACTOR ASSEMBLY OF COMPLEX C SUBUNIT B CCB1, chloroplastic [Ananas comosus]|uniref:Protein COFACTOR ASSEMBLY OF COMPLEX C SUBUNIT B CCB1, chloroplastic n=1 Tax=Ananas comosus TaxID=4615 RepID=A0A199VGT1_ANACO|nr:Protein COFACTOR ASSEMBLY OF COMPLEX C SUBUNIT B CCB1, chloroplastic [Ananas comosus]